MKTPCIAIVGKGGVGKTTLSAFMIRYLLENSIYPILAVDADPSSCLGGVLGVEVHETIGGIRENTRSVAGGMPEGIPKQQYLELRVQEALTEAKHFDLLTMGRPEGPGCYCFVNNLLRDNLDRLANSYRTTVIDCEAGLEHLSRRTSRDVDIMIHVADPTIKALQTLDKVLEISQELDNKISRKLLILNRIPSGSEEKVRQAAANCIDISQFEAIGILPQDETIFDIELEGKPLLDDSVEIPSYNAFKNFISSLKQPIIS